MKSDCAVSENIHTTHTEDFLFCTSHFASKILTFNTPPSPRNYDLPLGGYGFFLELHIGISRKGIEVGEGAGRGGGGATKPKTTFHGEGKDVFFCNNSKCYKVAFTFLIWTEDT